MKAKGVTSSAVKKQIYLDHYKKALYENQHCYTNVNVIKSRNHEVFTERITKLSLSSFNDKHVILSDGIRFYLQCLFLD